MNKKKATQQEVWDAIAIKWKEFRVRTEQNVLTYLEGKKGRILDLGCGSGRNFNKQKELEWYACDFSKEMLTYAKNKAEQLKMNVQLQQTTTEKLPYPNEYFDHALLYAVLHCIETEEQRNKTIEELYRILKKGGTTLISVWSGKGPRIQQYKQVEESHIPWTINGKKYERYTKIFKKEELEKLLTKKGFTIKKSWEERNINIIATK